jgi:hypothetical protein
MCRDINVCNFYSAGVANHQRTWNWKYVKQKVCLVYSCMYVDGLFSYQKTSTLVCLGRTWNGKFSYLFCPFGMLCGHLLHVMTAWYILCPFVILFPFWFIVSRKIIWQPWCKTETLTLDPACTTNPLASSPSTYRKQNPDQEANG